MASSKLTASFDTTVEPAALDEQFLGSTARPGQGMVLEQSVRRNEHNPGYCTCSVRGDEDWMVAEWPEPLAPTGVLKNHVTLAAAATTTTWWSFVQVAVPRQPAERLRSWWSRLEGWISRSDDHDRIEPMPEENV